LRSRGDVDERKNSGKRGKRGGGRRGSPNSLRMERATNQCSVERTKTGWGARGGQEASKGSVKQWCFAEDVGFDFSSAGD